VSAEGRRSDGAEVPSPSKQSSPNDLFIASNSQLAIAFNGRLYAYLFMFLIIALGTLAILNQMVP
jgi:hypothetical protein